MSTILLIEQAPDLRLFEVSALEAAGHKVFVCCGGRDAFAGCDLMRTGSCILPDIADVIVFTLPLRIELRGRTYRGEHLLRSYRDHAIYGAKPMLIVGEEIPLDLPGRGQVVFVPRHAEPDRILAAIGSLIPPDAPAPPSDPRAAPQRPGGWRGALTGD